MELVQLQYGLCTSSSSVFLIDVARRRLGVIATRELLALEK
jgi:hypothetical protein